MGVAYVWILDPYAKKAFVVTAAAGLYEVTDGVLRTANPTFEIPLAGLFE
jgi:hypothetical protein